MILKDSFRRNIVEFSDYKTIQQFAEKISEKLWIKIYDIAQHQ